MRARDLGWCIGAAVLAWCWSAGAVIKIDFPVSKVYTESKAVLVGSVVKVNADNRVVDVKVGETVKGDAAGAVLRVQIVEPAGLIKQVAAGQPVVVFVGEAGGKPAAVLHLADTWLLAEGIPDANPPAWRVLQVHDAVRGFPGRTAALVRALGELKAGRPAILDNLALEAFRGGTKEVANLKVKPIWLTATDLNADGKLDLLVGTADGVRVFIVGAQGYADATGAWALAGAAGGHCALGDADGDGKPDLLVGKSVWVRSGDKFSLLAKDLALPPESDWLAAALADVTGDKRADVVVLLKNGTLVVLANPGAAGKPWAESSRRLWEDAEVPGAAAFSTDWGDNGELCVLAVRANDVTRYAVRPQDGPAANFQRLTGVPLASYKGLNGKPMKVVMATPVDYDGNGKADYVIITESGGLTLVNRGFGAFLTNSVIHTVFHAAGEKRLPFKLTAGTLVAPGAVQGGKVPRQNLLVLTEDGRLFEMDNRE